MFYGLITCTSQDTDTLKKEEEGRIKHQKELLNFLTFDLEGPLEIKVLTINVRLNISSDFRKTSLSLLFRARHELGVQRPGF